MTTIGTLCGANLCLDTDDETVIAAARKILADMAKSHFAMLPTGDQAS